MRLIRQDERSNTDEHQKWGNPRNYIMTQMIDTPLFYMNSVDYFRWCFVWWMQKIEKNSRSFGWCFFMSQTKRFSFRRSLPSHSTSGVFVGICVFWSVGHITLRCCISKLSVPHKTIIGRENFSCNFFSVVIRVHYLVAAIAFDVESESVYFYFRTKNHNCLPEDYRCCATLFVCMLISHQFFRFHFVRPLFSLICTFEWNSDG